LKPAPGLYEQLITRGFDQALRVSSEALDASREDLIAEAAPHVLARVVHDGLIRALRSLPEDGRIHHQVALTNAVLELVAGSAPSSGLGAEDSIGDPAQMLLALRDQDRRLSRNDPGRRRRSSSARARVEGDARRAPPARKVGDSTGLPERGVRPCHGREGHDAAR